MSTPRASNLGHTHEIPLRAAVADEVQRGPGAAILSQPQRLEVLQASVYPDCDFQAIEQVVRYCDALGINPLHKPVHVVCGWDVQTGQFRQSLIPGIGLYRTIAARTGWSGMDEPEFGPDVTELVGGQQITYPRWCRITVRRRLASGEVAQFTAKEFWRENVVLKASDDGNPGSPNEPWTRRPYGQLAKCTEAQALRKAFPEIGSLPVIEEIDDQRLALGGMAQLPPRESMPAPCAAPSAELEARPKRRRKSAAAAAAGPLPADLAAPPEQPAATELASSAPPAALQGPLASPWQMPLVLTAAVAPTHTLHPQQHGDGDAPASAGEQAYLTKLLTAKRMAPAAAFEAAGLALRESLEGLTQFEFTALQKVL